MKRRIAAVLSAALVATGLMMLGSTQPASADVCLGQGNATVGAPGLVYPLTPATTANPSTISVRLQGVRTLTWSITLALPTGVCAPSLTGLSASGTLTGYCGHSIGSGLDTAGHRVTWTSVGSVLLLTGGVSGVANAIPNAVAGESCATGALGFLVTGAVTRQHCTTTKTKTQTLTPPTPDVLTTTQVGATTVSLHVSPQSVHVAGLTCVGTQL